MWPGDAIAVMCIFVCDVGAVVRCVGYGLDGVKARYEVTFNNAVPLYTNLAVGFVWVRYRTDRLASYGCFFVVSESSG